MAYVWHETSLMHMLLEHIVKHVKVNWEGGF